jgi:hypothetical protein
VSLTEAMILEEVVAEDVLGLIVQLNRDGIARELVVIILRVLLVDATRRGKLLNIRRSC